MRNIQLIALLVAFTLISSSCRKDPYSKYNRKIVGEWQFSRIQFKAYGALLKEDYMSLYGNSTFRLKDEGIAYFEHNNRTYSGNWDILLNNCTNSCEEELFISVYNYEFDHLLQFSLNELELTNRKIDSQTSTYEGTWTYRLRKL
jgi:hypothetical protein